MAMTRARKTCEVYQIVEAVIWKREVASRHRGQYIRRVSTIMIDMLYLNNNIRYITGCYIGYRSLVARYGKEHNKHGRSGMTR